MDACGVSVGGACVGCGGGGGGGEAGGGCMFGVASMGLNICCQNM